MAVIILLTLCSCSQKKETVRPLPDKQLQEYIFQSLNNSTAPSYFERLMKHRLLMPGGKCLYLFETNYPECAGILDSSGFYCDALDDGSWLDDLLFFMEENRLGDEVLSLLEDEENFIPPIVEYENLEDFENQEADSEKTEQSDSDENGLQNTESEPETVEKRLTDSYNRLKIMEFGKERFVPYNNGDETVFVHYSDNKAIRLFYDSKYRLVKKEYWRMNSVQDSGITGTEVYEYEKDSEYPYKKIIENENAKIVSNLNQNGFVIKAEKFVFETKDDDESQTKTEKSVSVSVYEYDSYDRLIMEKCTENNLEKKQKYIYKTAPKTSDDSKKDKSDEIPPDYEYYENNVLRTKTEYSAKDKYSTLIIFDKRNSVRTYYENHVKVRDVYITDGVEKRIRVYEQPQEQEQEQE